MLNPTELTIKQRVEFYKMRLLNEQPISYAEYQWYLDNKPNEFDLAYIQGIQANA